MTKKQIKRISDWGATVIGAIVAVANAWLNIDWEHFEFNTNNCFKLGLSAVIALGGYLSRFKTKGIQTTDDQPTDPKP